jgi:hypothetical protein
VLVPGKRLIMPDRTPAEVELSGTSEHLRGCFLECLPWAAGDHREGSLDNLNTTGSLLSFGTLIAHPAHEAGGRAE